jgi:hypothetical protein
MRPLETLQAELDQVHMLLAKTPATESVTVTDLTQRSRELAAQLAESRRGSPPARVHARV